MRNIANVSNVFLFALNCIVFTSKNTPISGPVVAELVMSADSITPGKKPVIYAIIVTRKAYATATYLIVCSCALSS